MKKEEINPDREKRRNFPTENSSFTSNSSKNGIKAKRLEILNRYHYNPFEEVEGEDQCELWKKLMKNEVVNMYGSTDDNPQELSMKLVQNFFKDLHIL